MKHSRKSGAITVEVAIGIALAVIVVLVALGLFSENLATMISNSGMANMFKNSNKTTYSSFGRDYTDSQVNVQLIGEQGLAMLRNIANNKAIEQIDKYMSGADTSVTNVNSITYLAIAINAIVGSPDICVYMKKDSDKKCDNDNIGGVSYYVTLNGGSITINKKGGGIPSKYPTVGADFSSGAAGITIKTFSGNTIITTNPMTSTNYVPPTSKTAIYEYIKDLSAFADSSNTVYDPVILIKAINAATTSHTATTELINALVGSNGLLPQAQISMQSAHDSCVSWWGDMPGRWGTMPEQCGEWHESSSDHYVNNNKLSKISSDINAIKNLLASNKDSDATDIVNNLLTSSYLTDLITMLQYDHINGSCAWFTNTMNEILAPFGSTSPACVPY